MLSKKEEIKTEAQSYLEHSGFAWNCFYAYEAIANAYAENPEKIAIAKSLFETILFSLSKTLQIELSKMYCDSGKAKTIYNFINQLKANQTIFDKNKGNIKRDLEQIDQDYRDLEPIVEKLKQRRNRYLAHNDKTYFDNKVNPARDFYISIEEFKKLLRFAMLLPSRVLYYFDDDNGVYFPSDQVSKDVQMLIDHIVV